MEMKYKTVYNCLFFLYVNMSVFGSCSPSVKNIDTTSKSAFKNYDSLLLSNHPIGYWLTKKDDQTDASGHNLNGKYYGLSTTKTTLPNGETANVFNGTNNYFEIPDDDFLELTRTGVLTIEAWMRPDTSNFSATEGDGYVYWMGKGTTDNQSWAARIYNTNNATRSQRISGYCFNLSGGLGAGSFFQDNNVTNAWIYYVLVINTVKKSADYPTGYIKIYKNGILRDMDDLKEYNIVPKNGTAPFRIGTRNMGSFFKGAIGKVALYDYELTASQLLIHNKCMLGWY